MVKISKLISDMAKKLRARMRSGKIGNKLGKASQTPKIQSNRKIATMSQFSDNDEAVAATLAAAILSTRNEKINQNFELAPVQTAVSVFFSCVDAVREHRKKRETTSS